MSLLDKAKEKATQLASTAKEKVDDFKEQRKADGVLADLGRITFRQHTDAGTDGDTAEIAKMVSELKSLAAQGAVILPAAGDHDASSTGQPMPTPYPTATPDAPVPDPASPPAGVS